MARKALYICSGVFNCIIGGMGCLFGLLFFVLTKVIKNMFSGSSEFIDDFVKELAALNSDYEYLLEASKDDVVSFIMKIVFIISAVLIVLGLIWITFGVFNCLLARRHHIVFGKRPALKVIFIIASWLLLTFNVANITTTIAACLKDKNKDNMPPLYTSENNN